MIIQKELKVAFEEAWNTDKVRWSFLITLDNLTLCYRIKWTIVFQPAVKTQFA